MKEAADDAPEFPWELLHVWQWFSELNTGRSSNGFSLNPIAWAEILAWVTLTGNDPEPWEVRALIRLDAAYRVASQKKTDAPVPPKVPKQRKK